MEQALNLAVSEDRDLFVGESSLNAVRVVSQYIIIFIVILFLIPYFFCLMALVEILVTNDKVTSLESTEIILVSRLVSYQCHHQGLQRVFVSYQSHNWDQTLHYSYDMEIWTKSRC